MTFSCFLQCQPPKTTHHSKRIVKAGKFSRLADTPQLEKAKDLLTGLLLEKRGPNHQPLKSPVSLTIEATWPWPSTTNRKVRSAGRLPRVSKPDCSNFAKTLEDRLMELCFIEGDEGVCELIVRKFNGDEPGILIVIEEVSL